MSSKIREKRKSLCFKPLFSLSLRQSIVISKSKKYDNDISETQ